MPKVQFRKAYKGYKPGETGIISSLEYARLVDQKDKLGRPLVKYVESKDEKGEKTKDKGGPPVEAPKAETEKTTEVETRVTEPEGTREG